MQLTMLENMFPRHVLEFIMGAAGPEAKLGELAYQHDLVGGARKMGMIKTLPIDAPHSFAFSTLYMSACPYFQVSILFMDIVGFTSMSKEVAPQMVMEFLNDLFSKFDEICDKYNVYKVVFRHPRYPDSLIIVPLS